MAEEKKTRDKEIPEYKKKLVSELAEKMKSAKTILVASIKGLPSSQFHAIKKKLRGKADVKVAKKSIINRAIDETGKESLQGLKEKVDSDFALMFSEADPFDLSGTLTDNQTEAKAKAGDVVSEDINVEPGPTELVPGPAISELGAVGLKVAVEDGKLAIKQPHTLIKAGETVDDKLASVFGKLNILPMKVGFEPLAAYDSNDDKVYLDIKIDKEGALEELRTAIAKGLNFAVNIGNVNEKTIGYFIAKAGIEEKALEAKVSEGGSEEKKEEAPAEEVKDEAKEESSGEGEPAPAVEEEKKEESTSEEKPAEEAPAENTDDQTSEKEEDKA